MPVWLYNWMQIKEEKPLKTDKHTKKKKKQIWKEKNETKCNMWRQSIVPIKIIWML